MYKTSCQHTARAIETHLVGKAGALLTPSAYSANAWTPSVTVQF